MDRDAPGCGNDGAIGDGQQRLSEREDCSFHGDPRAEARPSALVPKDKRGAETGVKIYHQIAMSTAVSHSELISGNIGGQAITRLPCIAQLLARRS